MMAMFGHAQTPDDHLRRDARVRRSQRPIYCTDCRCSHYIEKSADEWPDHLRASDIEQRFVCTVCGRRGANFCPDFSEGKKPVGY
jgi:hypothetical protein